MRKFLLLALFAACLAEKGQIDGLTWHLTNWGYDTTGNQCADAANMPFKYSDCDEKTGLRRFCSASVRTCYCQNDGGKLTPASQTGQNNAFWLWCSGNGYKIESGQTPGHIDNKPIPTNWKDMCNKCTYPTCDQYYAPDCSKDSTGAPMNQFCAQKHCVTVGDKVMETIEVDSCPSNHQKNVAKCCLFGGESPEWCSCVENRDDRWMDVNYKASAVLGCLSDNCAGRVTWTDGSCTGNNVIRWNNTGGWRTALG